MPEKVMQKVSKMMPTLRPNGGQDLLKIQKYAKKGMAKIDAEIWGRKMSKYWFWRRFLDRFFVGFWCDLGVILGGFGEPKLVILGIGFGI